MATGRSSEDHGILGFEKDVKPGEPVKYYTNNDRRAQALWNILDSRGRRSLVSGWFVTWPVDVIRGAMISDRSGGGMEGGHYPPDLAPMLERIADLYSGEETDQATRDRFLGPALTPESLTVEQRRIYENIEKILLDTHQVDKLRLEWALELLREADEPYALTAVFFKGVDAVSHLAWIPMEPESFLPEVRYDDAGVARYGGLIQAYYDFMDEAIGELLAAVPAGTNIMIVSDHGMRAAATRTGSAVYHHNPVLARLGWLVASEEGHPDVKRSLVVDATRHWLEYSQVRRLWVNPERLDDLCKTEAACHEILEGMAGELRALESTGGISLFEEVKVFPDGDEVLPEPFILVRMGKALRAQIESGDEGQRDESYRIGTGTHPLTDLYSVRIRQNGTHTMDGILLMAGPGIRRGAQASSAALYDVAPTALRLLGLPRSREMEGRILKEVLNSRRLPPELADIPTYEDGEDIRRVPVSDLPAVKRQEELLRQRLRSLGYVK
jgi:predicted AlkP superfamily phosphohydrolase/phosphomutase